MRAIKAVVVVLLSALVGIVGWTAYREGRRVSWPSTPPLGRPLGPNTEPPWVEFDEVRKGSGSETDTLLYIRRDLASLQTRSFGANGVPQCCQESKPKSTRLTCDELAWLSQGMKDELAPLAPVYGREQATNQVEVSIVYRWRGPERRVVWLNPESSPKAPEGAWARLVGPLEDRSQRMIRGDTLLWRNVAEHSFLQIIVAAHSLASFAFLLSDEFSHTKVAVQRGFSTNC